MADPAKLARAQHSYNLLIGLDMSIEERAAMLDRVLERAGLSPLGPAALDAISQGLVSDLSEIGLEEDALADLIQALYTVDLTAVISEILVELTATMPGEPAPMPEPEPTESPAAPEPPAPEPAAPPDWTWDVALCLFDPSSRRHHLTLLRSGGHVSSTPAPRPEGFGPLVDRLIDAMPDADPIRMEGASQTFHTPPCPDGLLEQLLGDRAWPDQLYLVEIVHDLPNPCLIRQHFQLTDPSAQRPEPIQELMSTLSYRPAGLSLHAAQARTAAAWEGSARLQRPGQPTPFRPHLLAPGAVSALPLQCDWQLRSGWAIACTAVRPDGPQVSISSEAAMDGTISLDGQGHLQEHLAGNIGLSVGVFGADGGQAHTGTVPLPQPDWSRAADVGFGALGVVSTDDTGHDLEPSGAHLSRRRRPSPGIPPRLTLSDSLALTGSLTGSLTGTAIIDASAQLSDTRSDSQSVGSTTAHAHAALTVRLTLSDGFHTVGIHLTDPGTATQTDQPPEDVGSGKRRAVSLSEAPAGTITLDGVARHGLQWRTQTTTLTGTWAEALEAISNGEWLGDAGSQRVRVAGQSSVEIGWVEAGYALSALEEE